ncbi:phosphatidate phosphatase APP1 ASCRUDRAFT_38145, partial [Ascoidea rubescens DSM 1968]
MNNYEIFVPLDSQFILYPSYTWQEDSLYHVNIRGWLFYCPQTMSKKNKIVFTVAKQLIRSNATDYANLDLINQNESNRSPYISNSNSNSQSSTSLPPRKKANPEDVLKERLKYFMAKSLPQVNITIKLGSDHDVPFESLVTKTLPTDYNGKFDILLKSSYKPSIIHVFVDSNNEIFQFQLPLFIHQNGISIISDIDDTIKKTDVVSDKRNLFNNVFIKDIKNWTLEGISDFFNEIYAKKSSKDIKFHYVSNSPWQLYSIISQFFQLTNMPPGSFHLKQYSGNYLNSFMEPAVERKRPGLYTILQKFPNRKFILLGDSGEQDLEAYTDIVRRFPGKVLGIYLRIVPNSFSDFGYDVKTLNQLKKIL